MTGDLNPDVSVVIVNWNTAPLLHQTLESLHRSTHGVTFETIVVDNASTDGSVATVRESWPQVRVIVNDENRGFGSANNAAFAVARGRYVLLLNSDTIVQPSTLPGLVAFLDAYPDAGCAGCRHLHGDGSLQRSMDSFPTLLKDFLCASELRRVPLVMSLLARSHAWWSAHDRVRDVDWVNGSCMMVRNVVVSQTGGFDETFFLYAEEIDWCYRIRQAGWRIYFTPTAEVIHLGGQSTQRIAGTRVLLLYMGQYRFYRKHYSRWRFAVLRVIVRASALVRLGLLGAAYIGSLATTRIGRVASELLTQEPQATESVAMARVWWAILTLR